MGLLLTPVKNIPVIQTGDRLAPLILSSLGDNNITLIDGDILVLAQKIVSKSEGRFVSLADVKPSPKAVEFADVTGKDPRFIELVLQESAEVLRTRPGTIIVEHRQGFVCANAGIDHSNVQSLGKQAEDWVLLLPVDADESARQIQAEIFRLRSVHVGILIIDSHGRAWRIGTVGAAIGMAGVPGVVDLRGQPDLFGYTLRVTMVAAADELAAAASLVMGQAAEGTPVVHVRGFPYSLRESSVKELIRPRDMDLFR
jgi:coenzyme F420-0:L-glutamate ligase/coenzyme F420-1:gamma-L-glutamate ligase